MCGKCNSTRVCLYRIFGTWLVKEFVVSLEKEQQEFFQFAASMSTSAMKSTLTKMLVRENMKERNQFQE